MLDDELPAIAALLRSNRSAALATRGDDGAPSASFAAFVPAPDFSSVLLLCSRLAAHTRHLLADPRAALLISEVDDGRADVQTLARISLQGAVTAIARDTPEWMLEHERYLARLPEAAQLFELPDFILFRFEITSARYVGGFARAYTLTSEHLRRASASSQF